MNRGVFSNKLSLHRMLFFLDKTVKIASIPFGVSYYEIYNIKADIIFPSIKNGTPRFTYLGLVKNKAYFFYPSRVPEFPSVYFYRFMLLIFLIICFVFFALVIFIICLVYPMLPMSLDGSFIDCPLRFTPE